MRIPYEIVSIEVEKLYTKEFLPNDKRGIEEHCKFIQDYIEACGWKIDDYIGRMWQEELN